MAAVEGNAEEASSHSPLLTEKHLEASLALLRKRTATDVGAPSLTSGTKWDDVGGLEHCKRAIMDTVDLPLKHRALFRRVLLVQPGLLGEEWGSIFPLPSCPCHAFSGCHQSCARDAAAAAAQTDPIKTDLSAFPVAFSPLCEQRRPPSTVRSAALRPPWDGKDAAGALPVHLLSCPEKQR